MKQSIKVIFIKDGWGGSIHGSLPIILDIELTNEKPFGLSEGHHHAWKGGYLSLEGLFKGAKKAELFNRQETAELYNYLKECYEKNKSSREVAEHIVNNIELYQFIEE